MPGQPVFGRARRLLSGGTSTRPRSSASGIMINHSPHGKLTWPKSPLATRSQQIEDCIQYCTNVCRARSAPGQRSWKKRSDEFQGLNSLDRLHTGSKAKPAKRVLHQTPALAFQAVSSYLERQPVFSKICFRWIFTVPGLIPRRGPTSLLPRPVATSSTTCFSRAVNGDPSRSVRPNLGKVQLSSGIRFHPIALRP